MIIPRDTFERGDAGAELLWAFAHRLGLTLFKGQAPAGALVISPDGRTATLEMENVAVVDQPKWPALDSVGTPATMYPPILCAVSKEGLGINS